MKLNRAIFNRAGDAPPFAVRNQGDRAVVYVYDEISPWGIDGAEFAREIDKLTANVIEVRINSPGGYVSDTAVMVNALKRHPARVEAFIDGLAASSATHIAIAADHVQMAENAFFVIHNPWSFALGDAAELRKQADVLDKFRDVIAAQYVAKSGKTPEQIAEWMNAETWFDANEAKAQGFIDQIGDKVEAQASYDLSIFNNTPAQLNSGGQPKTKREIERVLRDAGLSRQQAAALVSNGYAALDQRDADAAASIIKRNINILTGE